MFLLYIASSLIVAVTPIKSFLVPSHWWWRRRRSCEEGTLESVHLGFVIYIDVHGSISYLPVDHSVQRGYGQQDMLAWWWWQLFFAVRSSDLVFVTPVRPSVLACGVSWICNSSSNAGLFSRAVVWWGHGLDDFMSTINNGMLATIMECMRQCTISPFGGIKIVDLGMQLFYLFFWGVYSIRLVNRSKCFHENKINHHLSQKTCIIGQRNYT